MKVTTWAVGATGLLLAALGLSFLLDPVPRASDAAGFALLGAGLLFGYLAAALAFQMRWWHWWIPAAWIGLDVAALFLAYKDTFSAELGFFGPLEMAVQIVIHVLVAPFEVLLGFVVGFVEPGAWIVVVACLTVALLGAELIRRRLWPQARSEASRSDAQAREARF